MATPGIARTQEVSLQDNIADAYILNRGEEIYGRKSDPKIPVNKPDIDGREEQLILQGLGSLGNILFPGIGTVAGAGLGTLGGYRSPEAKRAKLNSLAEQARLDDGRAGGYNSDNNSYEILDKETQLLYNITPDQLTSTYISQRQKALNNTPEVRALKAAGKTPEEIFPKGALTTTDDIIEFNNNYKDTLRLRNEVNDTIMGPQLLADAEAKLGRKLNKTELLKLKTTAAIKDPNEQRAQSREAREVEARKDQRSQIESNIKVNEANQNLNSIIARNNIKTERAKIDYENKANERDFQIAQMEITEARRSSELDRQLRRDIAILGIDDKAAERDYQARRDERKDRQIFMLQLMKGLGNLGTSLSAYML